MSPSPTLQPLPAPSPEAIAALAPTGQLRAAINLSNFLLVTGTDSHGDPVGVSPGIARALADVLGVGIELITFPSPGSVADAAGDGVWDIGNIGAEPARAEFIDFTAAYAEIEATYLVRGDSPLRSFEQVDQPGVRIAVKARAAYCLWLERNLQHAELLQFPSAEEAFDTFLSDELDAFAALRPGLSSPLEALPEAHVLDGYFTTVQQAIGTPKGRNAAGFAFLSAFVEHTKRSGLVADLIADHQQSGRLSVAAPLPD